MNAKCILSLNLNEQKMVILQKKHNVKRCGLAEEAGTDISYVHLILWNGCSHSNWVFRPILTVATVWNTRVTGDIYLPFYSRFTWSSKFFYRIELIILFVDTAIEIEYKEKSCKIVPRWCHSHLPRGHKTNYTFGKDHFYPSPKPIRLKFKTFLLLFSVLSLSLSLSFSVSLKIAFSFLPLSLPSVSNQWVFLTKCSRLYSISKKFRKWLDFLELGSILF